MATLHQLEVISPTGEVKFYNLDPGKGTLNIGRHPDNDVVLSGVGIAHFHAILDCRGNGHQILILSEEGKAVLQDKPLPPNEFTFLNLWDVVQFDSYTLMLVESTETPVLQEPVSVTQTAESSSDIQASTEKTALISPIEQKPIVNLPVPVSQAVSQHTVQYKDALDIWIPIEVSEHEWVIDPGQSVSLDVTITNGGSVTAAFKVQIVGQGVTEGWLVCSYPDKQQVNLNEGERGSLTVNMEVIRNPASRAGTHSLAVVVTSLTPTHPGQSSQKSLTLTVNPYYEFFVGELSHQEGKVVFPNKSFQKTLLPVSNVSNTATLFHITAMDREQVCDFEFYKPDEELGKFVKQADFSLSPAQMFHVPIHITPHEPPKLFGKKREYSFEVSVSMAEDPKNVYARRGQLVTIPKIGPLMTRALIGLFVLMFLLTLLLGFRPKLYCFAEPSLAHNAKTCPLDEPKFLQRFFGVAPTDRSVGPIQVTAGDPLTLTWEASAFTTVDITAIYANADRDPEPVNLEGLDGESNLIVPSSDVTYKVVGHNLLSRFLPFLVNESSITFDVERIYPEIEKFEPKVSRVMVGEYAILEWNVKNANNLKIFVDPPLSDGDQIDLNGQLSGMRSIELPKEANFSFRLEVENTASDTSSDSSFQVEAFVPTPTHTPLPPPPKVMYFRAYPPEIVLGQEVTLEWEVTTADDVAIDPLGPVGLIGPFIFKPDKEGTQIFTLIASNGGIQATPLTTQIFVGPEPLPPEISYIKASPEIVTLGESTELKWEVKGECTAIELSGPALNANIDVTEATTHTVEPPEDTFYILTAYNGDLKSTLQVEVKVRPLPPTIRYFSAKSGAEQDTGDITPLAPDANGFPQYRINAGAPVALCWQVENADLVVLKSTSMGIDEPQSLVACYSFLMPGWEGNTGRSYELYAEKDEAAESKTAILTLFCHCPDGPAPPDSQTFEIHQATSGLTLTWSYPVLSASDSDIWGFNIYYSENNWLGFENYDPIAQYDRSADDPTTTTFQWLDTSRTCGGSYRLTVLYTDACHTDVYENKANFAEKSAPSCLTSNVP